MSLLFRSEPSIKGMKRFMKKSSISIGQWWKLIPVLTKYQR